MSCFRIVNMMKVNVFSILDPPEFKFPDILDLRDVFDHHVSVFSPI